MICLTVAQAQKENLAYKYKILLFWNPTPIFLFEGNFNLSSDLVSECLLLLTAFEVQDFGPVI